MSYGQLVEVSVDTSELDQRLDSLVTEDRVQELIAAKVEEYISDESLMSHSAVVDTIEEHIKDNLDISGEVESALEGYDIQSESAVQQMIDDALDSHESMTESEVQNLIDTAIADADNADVDALENQVKDLERRLDVYAQKFDHLQALNLGLTQRVQTLEDRASNTEARLANHGVVMDLLRAAARKLLGLD